MQAAQELRFAHEQTIMARLRGQKPIDLGRTGAAELFVNAFSVQSEFQRDMFGRLSPPDTVAGQVRERINQYLKHTKENPAERLNTNVLSVDSDEEEWRVYLDNLGADGKILPSGLARLEIDMETRLKRELGQRDQHSEWKVEYDRVKAKIEEVRKKIATHILDSSDPAPWL